MHTLSEVFNSVPQGGRFVDTADPQRGWLKVAQRDDLHLDGMVVDLFTGDVIHYSYIRGMHINVYDRTGGFLFTVTQGT